MVGCLSVGQSVQPSKILLTLNFMLQSLYITSPVCSRMSLWESIKQWSGVCLSVSLSSLVEFNSSYLELHGAEFVHNVAHVFTNDRPRYLVITLGRWLYRVTRHVIETNNVAHHPDCFVERTHPTTQQLHTSDSARSAFPWQVTSDEDYKISKLIPQRTGIIYNRTGITDIRLCLWYGS